MDECAEMTHDCSPHANCVNQVGTFTCKCREGFVGDGKDCIEVHTVLSGIARLL